MLYFGLIIVTGYVGFFTMAGCCSAALVMRWGWEAFGIGIGVAFAFCACTSPVSIASGGVCLVASASPPACTPATRPATRPAAHRVRARRTAVARRWAHVCCSPYTCIRMHTHGTGLTSAALHTPAYACIHMALGSRLLLSASHHVPLARVASHHVPLARVARRRPSSSPWSKSTSNRSGASSPLLHETKISLRRRHHLPSSLTLRQPSRAPSPLHPPRRPTRRRRCRRRSRRRSQLCRRRHHRPCTHDARIWSPHTYAHQQLFCSPVGGDLSAPPRTRERRKLAPERKGARQAI